ncbi:MAG: two-component regulator propeller domain-containing protein [Bacteroidales bacterium]
MLLIRCNIPGKGINAFLGIFLFVLSLSNGFTQPGNNSGNLPENYHFNQFTVDQGLSQNMIHSIHQDHLGFIWIGTKDGLNMFDGYSFRVFKYDPLDDHSLSDNHITVIYEDPLHRLWVGTLNGGLHYFDRITERFVRFLHDPDNENSISGNHIQSVTGDNDGNLWAGTNGGGLNKLVFTSGDSLPGKDNLNIVRFDSPGSGFPETGASIQSLFIDSNNRLWIGTARHVFTFDYLVNASPFNNIPLLLNDYTGSPEVITSGDTNAGGRVIFEDNNGDIWMGNRHGLFILDDDRQLFSHFGLRGKPFPHVNVRAATNFNNLGKEEIWIGSGSKIYILDPLTGEYVEVSRNKYPDRGLQRGDIISLYSDNGNSVWVGSSGYGLSLFSPGSKKFVHASDMVPEGTGTLVSSRDLSIRSFYESTYDPGTIWIGANQGLFKVNRENQVMEHLQSFGTSGQQNLMIFSINGDENGLLWIGTRLGLIRFNPEDKSYKIFPSRLSYKDEGIETRVSYVHISNGNIWVLTPNTIALLDLETGEFAHTRYNHEPLDQYRAAVFPTLYEDRQGNFWIAASNGLHYFDVKSSEISSYPVNPSGYHSGPLNDITAILADPSDPDRFLWLGTKGGFIRFDIKSMSIDVFTEKHGLANNMVYGILYDDAGHIWISTNRGLSRFSIDEKEFKNYTKADGLQSNEFNSGAYYKSPRGELFFGGINGYNSFFPSDIEQKHFMAPVVFTGFRILNKNLEQDSLKSLYKINEGGYVDLTYGQNSFTIDFASLDFASPENNSFAYSMTASGERWIGTGNSRSITFTGLRPGIYSLRVRGTNSDGVWSDREASLKITIAVPWWQQTWIYLLYLFVVAVIILGFRKYELTHIRLKDRMKIADFETKKLKELDHLKSQFFANISHEFRTPLTLIKGPLEELIDEETDPQKINVLRKMHTNSSRLLQLINQVLDLSRLESDNYNLKAQTGDIVGYIKGITMSFASMADQKKIKLSIEMSPDLVNEGLPDNFYFDPDIIDKIFNNLLSNALKFTPANGSVTVKVCMKNEKDNTDRLEFIVTDTGIGIPADKLPFIYDRFYQVDSSSVREYEGSGVGLAYVKELVRVHKAEIRVKSSPGSGTTFSLRFPLGRDHLLPDQITVPVRQDLPDPKNSDIVADDGFPAYIKGNIPETNGKPLVLIVEDHSEVRNYINEGIHMEYKVLESSNAKEGFAIAEEKIPDLIISDVMMPGTNGYEFCEKLKSGDKTSHIPVIMLTARAEDTDRITGFESGADGYLYKPFNVKELRIRIKNLIDSRSELRERFSSNSIIKPGEISVTPRDASFMEMLLKVVEKNIDNSAFSVEDLGREVAMSPSQIHRKLKATVNMPANHFIRSVRMHRAMDLLRKEAGNISEIAYMVGYDDPGYFTKSFRAFFGKLPSDIKDRQ